MKPLILLCLAIITSGCAVTFHSQVTSLSDPELKVCCSYIIIPDSKEVDISTIEWRRFERMTGSLVEQELGYIRAINGEPADIGIIVGAGIGDPREVLSSTPIWGKTGTEIIGSTTHGTSNSSGSANYIGYGTNINLNTNSTSRTTYQTQDTYGVVGIQTNSSTIYDRWLMISGYSLVEKDTPQVWKTTVRSSGSNWDINIVIPYLLHATRRYIGTTTNRVKNVYTPATKRVINNLLLDPVKPTVELQQLEIDRQREEDLVDQILDEVEQIENDQVE